jgi:hypothetical protein
MISVMHRSLRLSLLLGIATVAGCANPEKDQYFIPIDALEPGAGIFSNGEPIPTEDYPIAVRSAVIIGDLLVGGEVARELSEPPAATASADELAAADTGVEPIVLSDEQARLGSDEASPEADPGARERAREIAFAELSAAEQQRLVADADRALLFEAWMRSRVEPYDVTSTDVLRVQQLLSELGYNPGPLDGIPGPRTRAAIESFQQSLGLPVTGQVTPGLLDRLAIERS